MSQHDSDTSPINPLFGYTITGAARAMGITPTVLRSNLIETGEIAIARRGRFIALVMGHEIIRWIEATMEAKVEADASTGRPGKVAA